MINFLKKLFNHSNGNGKIDELREEVITNKKKDVKALRKLNKKIKLLLKTGSVEVTLKNVQGVIKEIERNENK